jgi:hypothetical protein
MFQSLLICYIRCTCCRVEFSENIALALVTCWLNTSEFRALLECKALASMKGDSVTLSDSHCTFLSQTAGFHSQITTMQKGTL